VDAFLHLEPASGDEDSRGWAAPVAATIYYRRTAPESVEAEKRVQAALEEYRVDLVKSRFAARGVPLEPETLVVVDARDIATADEKRSAQLARLLPLIMVLLLLTGGSFAAIDLVAGEKERDTLETLYIHPVPVSSIVRGKFAVILAVSLAAVLLNCAGMVLGVELCRWLGLGGGDETWFPVFLPPLETLGLILLLVIPFAVFSSAVLLAISAYARSFREAQTYLLPVTLVALLAVTLALVPQIRLASIVAVIPISNVALGIREALTGHLLPVPYAVALGSSCLYAWIALRKATALLHREEIVLSLGPPSRVEDIDAASGARRAMCFAAFMLLAVWYLGGLLQSWDLVAGLALTLWGVVLLPSLAYPLLCRLPPRELFALRAARLSSYLWLVPLLAATVGLNLAYLQFQDLFLPLPEAAEAFELPEVMDLPVLWIVLLFAVSPAICEELLWRGVLQGELEKQRRPVRTVLIVGLFFGLFHLSIYRLVTTGMTGAVLALVRLRSGSIFPCMLFHAAFNAVLLLLVRNLDQGILDVVAGPAVWVPCLAVVGLSLWAMRASPRFSPR
jgi:sodium transport system permease protein